MNSRMVLTGTGVAVTSFAAVYTSLGHVDAAMVTKSHDWMAEPITDQQTLEQVSEYFLDK